MTHIEIFFGISRYNPYFAAKIYPAFLLVFSFQTDPDIFYLQKMRWTYCICTEKYLIFFYFRF